MTAADRPSCHVERRDGESEQNVLARFRELHPQCLFRMLIAGGRMVSVECESLASHR